MNYINTQTMRYPVTEQEIRNQNPNTSFPTPFIPPPEFELVFPAPPPPHNTVIQMAKQVAPVLTDKGHWEQTWEVISRFSEYTDSSGVIHTVASQEADALARDEKDKMDRLQNQIVSSTQRRLDDFARTRKYDGILSACTYATSAIPEFQSEGQYCVDSRDATWAALYTIMAEVASGSRPVPGGFADIEPDLPPLVWPQ